MWAVAAEAGGARRALQRERTWAFARGCFAVREAVCGRSPQSRGERGEGNSESGGGIAGGALRLSGVAGRCVRELAARCDSAGSPAGVCGSWSGARGSRSGCVPRLAEGNAHLDFKIKKKTRMAKVMDVSVHTCAARQCAR